MARRPLIIVAAGGLARESAAALSLLDDYELIGCLDDDLHAWGTGTGPLQVLGGLDELQSVSSDAALLVTAGRGAERRHIVARLRGLDVEDDRYATVIHPSVEIPVSCHVGAGTILLAHVALTADVVVGSHVVVMPHCTLTHDDIVADYVTLAAGVSLGGGVRIGEAAYVGMNTCVRQHLVVGADSVVGMGSVVTRNVPRGETWAGVPASPLADRPKGQT